MSANFVVYSRQCVDKEFFDRTVMKAGGTVSDPSDDQSIREGHIDNNGESSTPIFLRVAPMEELYQDEDQDLFELLGGEPLSRIDIWPAKWSEAPMISYLVTLAGDLDYVVTNFSDILMRGSEVKEKKGFG